MKPELLARLLARIDRLERLLARMYRRQDCGFEATELLNQLQDECRLYGRPDESQHLDAAERMIEESNRE